MSYKNLDDRLFNGSYVLVTGGTGFTGSHLIQRLCDLGASVVAIIRPESKVEQLSNYPVQWIKGSIFDEKTIDKAFKYEIEYVFNVAGAFRKKNIPESEYWNVNVLTPQLLAGKAANLSTFKRFVHFSTIGVHGHIEHPPANEDHPFSTNDIYQETKAEAELWLRSFAENNHLPLTIMRPCSIIGPRDTRMLKIFRYAKKGYFPIVPNQKMLLHFIHVADLVDFAIHASLSEQTVNKIYICGNPTYTDTKSIAIELGKIFQKKILFIPLPYTPLLYLSIFIERISKILHVEPILYARRVKFYSIDRAFDTSKMQNVKGFKLKFDNKTALKNTAQWYEEQKWL